MSSSWERKLQNYSGVRVVYFINDLLLPGWPMVNGVTSPLRILPHAKPNQLVLCSYDPIIVPNIHIWISIVFIKILICAWVFGSLSVMPRCQVFFSSMTVEARFFFAFGTQKEKLSTALHMKTSR